LEGAKERHDRGARLGGRASLTDCRALQSRGLTLSAGDVCISGRHEGLRPIGNPAGSPSLAGDPDADSSRPSFWFAAASIGRHQVLGGCRALLPAAVTRNSLNTPLPLYRGERILAGVHL
jgi:hypothetical protein